jgi:hypothetical protein
LIIMIEPIGMFDLNSTLALTPTCKVGLNILDKSMMNIFFLITYFSFATIGLFFYFFPSKIFLLQPFGMKVFFL